MVDEGETVVIGMEVFSISVKRKDGNLFLSGMVPDRRGGFVDFWSPRKAMVDPGNALATLINCWSRVAGPFCEDGDENGSFDLASLLIEPAGSVPLVRSDVFSTITVGAAQHALEEHSVVAVEVLIGLGDLLAEEISDEDLRVRWRSVREKTDLLAFEASVDMESRRDCLDEESEWYASHLGVDPAAYRSAARWLHARQTLFGVEGEGSDIPASEWQPMHIPDGMPPESEIDALVARAAAAIEESVDEFGRSALYSRNCDARQIAVYRRWYGSVDKAKASSPGRAG